MLAAVSAAQVIGLGLPARCLSSRKAMTPRTPEMTTVAMITWPMAAPAADGADCASVSS